MDADNDALLTLFRDSFLNSPHVAVMIVDKALNIVWHNKSFAQEFKQGDDLVGKKCYQVTGVETQHQGCPIQSSLHHGKYTKCFFDFGDKNFFGLTIPPGNGYAAKIHTYLPKVAENSVEEA